MEIHPNGPRDLPNHPTTLKNGQETRNSEKDNGRKQLKHIGFLISNIFGFPEVFEVPGGFKKLREACRLNFHLSWYLYVFMVPSYDQKTKKVND